MLRVVYTFFTGVLLATFVGVGIAAFYPAPTMPEHPLVFDERVAPNESETPEQKERQALYDTSFTAYQEAMKLYSRNVSIVALIGSLILMAIGLLSSEKFRVIADGFLFGSLLTLLYSVGWGFATEDNRYRFLVVTVGLVVALALGYMKFVAPQGDSKR
ncbi:hypothetical protein HYW32_01255 [Candidatus Berkelbacteria bacterium]|nr:hypothetical protein [Candidatus Berkelbacteria bacterium]